MMHYLLTTTIYDEKNETHQVNHHEHISEVTPQEEHKQVL